MGVRAHSGWAIVAVVGGTIDDPIVVERRRVTIVPSDEEAYTQPYHVAASLGLERGRAVVDRCAAHAERLAKEELRRLCDSLAPHKAAVCAILTSRTQEPPLFETALSSHTRIHAAEGLLFREAVARAAVACGFHVLALPESDIHGIAAKRWSSRAEVVQRKLSGMRRAVGPPWTRDEKLATLAGLLALR